MLMPRKPAVLLLLVLLSMPAMAAGRELAPRGGGQTSYSINGNPHTAFAGDRFLTVWREPMGHIGTYVMGAFSDRTGRTINDLAFPIMRMNGELQQFVPAGNGYALFWNDPEGRGHLTDIDLNGKVVRTRALTFTFSLFRGLRAAWNGTHFLVAVSYGGNAAEALLLDREGTVVHRNLALRPDSALFEIVPDAEGFTVLATGFAGISAYRITSDGTLAERPLGRAHGRAVSAATADGNLLVVWTASTPATTDLHAAVLTRDLEVRDPRVIHTFDSWMARARGLQRNGAEYVLVYDRNLADNSFALETMRFDGNGVLGITRVHDSVREPSAASNGSVIFVAFAASNELPFRVEGTSVAPNGSAGPTELLSLGRTRQTQPVIGAGGGRYLAAWTEITGSAAFVRGVSVGLDAEPITDNVVHPAYLSGRELAWNGTEYLAVELRNDKVLATRVTFDGIAIDAEPIVLGDANGNDWTTLGASVAWIGDRWAVTWRTYVDLRFATVSRAGIATAPRSIAVTSPLRQDFWRGFLSAAVAWNGTTALLVWTEEQRPPCGFFPPCASGENFTFAARLAPNGVLRDAVALEVPAASTLSLATSGAEFLLLGDRTATAIDASSTPRVLGSREIFNWNALGDVTWDGTSYAVALRYRGARWHLSVTHLDRNANVVGTRRGVETLPPDQFLPPSIAASLASSAVVAVQEGDAVDGARAVIYAENAMAPLPAPPPPPSNVRSHRVGGRYEVTWEPSNGTDVELYRVEALVIEAGWIGIQEVPADHPLRITTDYEHVRVRAFNAGGLSEPALPSTTPKRRSARH